MRPAVLLVLLACSVPPEGSAPSTVASAPPAQDAAPEDRIAARHILIAWAGAPQAAAVGRTHEEAVELARRTREELLAGADFARLARARSNDRGTARRGGTLGAFGRGEMQREFEAVAFALPVGALSEPVETPYGFHIIERLPLVEAHLAEIVVLWNEDGPEGRRTREASRARAEEAAARLRAGEPFEVVAREISDGQSGPWGGDLGWFQKGQLSPSLDDAAFALEPGEISGIIETPLGLHILRRVDDGTRTRGASR